MITFQNGNVTRTGEVWSPGPVARSVWVLVDGETVAVKLGTGRKLARQMDAPRWFVPPRGRDWVHMRARYLDEHKYAPALSAKDWRELTADQVAGEQLAFTA